MLLLAPTVVRLLALVVLLLAPVVLLLAPVFLFLVPVILLPALVVWLLAPPVVQLLAPVWSSYMCWWSDSLLQVFGPLHWVSGSLRNIRLGPGSKLTPMRKVSENWKTFTTFKKGF